MHARARELVELPVWKFLWPPSLNRAQRAFIEAANIERERWLELTMGRGDE
jgi:hypothetical protein